MVREIDHMMFSFSDLLLGSLVTKWTLIDVGYKY